MDYHRILYMCSRLLARLLYWCTSWTFLWLIEVILPPPNNLLQAPEGGIAVNGSPPVAPLRQRPHREDDPLPEIEPDVNVNSPIDIVIRQVEDFRTWCINRNCRIFLYPKILTYANEATRMKWYIAFPYEEQTYLAKFQDFLDGTLCNKRIQIVLLGSSLVSYGAPISLQYWAAALIPGQDGERYLLIYNPRVNLREAVDSHLVDQRNKLVSLVNARVRLQRAFVNRERLEQTQRDEDHLCSTFSWIRTIIDHGFEVFRPELDIRTRWTNMQEIHR